ncbi:outer membrane lipid asymmetry maintenance protein MlaD [Acetobacter sp. AN02]|uniref:outer membrane lipid asymmetry maintenance protein MlaD n=1 Tax=Acetobacter sp. AN02 TaxID=2894186 RepID=UPI0024343468|nr:outer membrane lipid asymmetry maintenance protein MlaD [Acetobacter sp. AN02]MDG6094835.1 outer membrane lipid asymmetry maintenance protein MlaD [Acetobacter sp. AN02]
MTTATGTGSRGGLSRPQIELLTGFVTLIVLAVLLGFAIVGTGYKHTPGYTLHAEFGHIDGLDAGSDVRLAGITIGHVLSERVDPKTFKAHVEFSIRPDVKLPTDSAAVITSDSLLGGKYIALSPGADDKMLEPGGKLMITQGSVSLEQLLSKFIFSVTDSLMKNNKASDPKAPDGDLK